MNVEVTVDFHDNALPSVRRFENVASLAAYLGRVPHMLGYQVNGGTTLTIRTVAGESK